MKRLARHRNTTVADTVARAVRLLRQEQMGRELAEAVADDERDWLEADTGDVVRLELGVPTGSEAGLSRPAVLVTAGQVLEQRPTVVHVVPLTTTLRGYESEIVLTADPDNGLSVYSAAQCQHIRAVATERVQARTGNVGPSALAQIREVLAVLLDL